MELRLTFLYTEQTWGKPKISVIILLYVLFPTYCRYFQREENGQTEKKGLSFRC